MQRKGTIYFDFKKIKDNLPLVIFISIFLLGVVIGSVSVCSSDFLLGIYSENFDNFFNVRKNCGFLEIFKSAFVQSFPFYLLAFVCGTSLVGCAVTPFVSAYKGFSFGCYAGYLYSNYKLNGIVFNALVLILPNLICIFGLVLLSIESFSFSYLLSGICIKGNHPINIYTNFKSYCVRSLFYFIFALLSILADMGLSAIFINYFNF